MIGAEKLDQLVQFFNFIYTVVNIDQISQTQLHCGCAKCFGIIVTL